METTNFSKDIILLDTHIWIWLVTGNEMMKKVFNHIEEGAKKSRLRISAISVLEVGMLEAKGRISFSMDCFEWVKQALSCPGLSVVPLTPEISISSSRLPGIFHGDPADRIIVATARNIGASLITKDEKIIQYGKEGFLNIITV